MAQNKNMVRSHIFRKVALLFIAGLLAIGALSTYVMVRPYKNKGGHRYDGVTTTAKKVVAK